jgi:hypothetical protein
VVCRTLPRQHWEGRTGSPAGGHSPLFQYPDSMSNKVPEVKPGVARAIAEPWTAIDLDALTGKVMRPLAVFLLALPRKHREREVANRARGAAA